MIKKTDLAIVSRSFWPEGQVIGEGLLQFAEQAAKKNTVCVITQSSIDLSEKLSEADRDAKFKIYSCNTYTNSSSGLLRRIVEALLFMLWTLISLLRTRPNNVYVSTNPPVVVPLIVALYCKFFNAKYLYHLQDIHPEAADIVVPINKYLLCFFKALDNFTLCNATAIVTLSEDMRTYILNRSATKSPVYLLDNPSFSIKPLVLDKRDKDIVFCGNAGRLQRMPLLISAIRTYLQKGGKLQFTFAGGGVYTPDIMLLANSFEQVSYLGVLSAVDALEVVNEHHWALLPIDDEVTKYAFPSKSSGYALAGTGIVAVCGEHTSVASWVVRHEVGVVCEPNHDSLVDCFFMLENSESNNSSLCHLMRERLQISYFAQRLFDMSLNNR